MPVSMSELVLRHKLIAADQLQECLARHCGGSEARLAAALVGNSILRPHQLELLYEIAAAEAVQDAAVIAGALEAFRGSPKARPSPGPDPDLAEGEKDPARRFGPYVLLREIGRGGMGIVHRAWHAEKRQTVAIKVLPLELAQEAEKARFAREAQLVARLQHSCIVRVHDVGSVGGRLYYAMDFIEGLALSDGIAKKSLSWQAAVRVISECALALQFAHDHGVVHRDIKPANILVEAKGHPYIVDFGLAKSDRDQSLTMTGQVMGSPLYMSPEQVEGRTKEIDARSDIYGLGATLYHAVAGQPPFSGTEFGAIFDQIRRVKPLAPSKRAAGLPEDLDHAILRSLEKRQADRYPSALEFGLDLKRILAGVRIDRPATEALIKTMVGPAPDAEDALTGLLSRRQLYRRLEQSIVPKDKPAEGPVSVLLFDFDGFKKVNDVHGSPAGDGVLRQFASMLKEVGGEEGIAGRHGGDSFLYFMPGVDKDSALTVADEVQQRLRDRPLGPADRPVTPLPLSGGVATLPEDGVNVQDLVNAANKALFVSKKSGGGRVSASGRLDEEIACEKDLLEALPCRTFIDREQEMAAAIGLFDQLANRRTATLFVQGEAGMGKSRFLREYAGRAANAGLLHLYVSCEEAKRYVPASALIQFVDRYFETRPVGQQNLRSRLNPHQRTTIREFVPAFGAWEAEFPEPAASERPRLMREALEAAVREMTRETPVLLILDNAAWADRPTLEILCKLGRDGSLPVGMVFALKGDPSALDRRKDAPLLDLISDFEKRGMKTVRMRPFGFDEMDAFFQAVVPGSQWPDEFVDTIAEASRGNPLYLETVLRLLIMNGNFKRSGGRWRVQPVSFDELPTSLEEAVKSILASLPPEADGLLTNAAVMGSAFNFHTLQAVSGLTEGDMLDLMDKIEAAGLIRGDGAGEKPGFEFSAGYLRDVRYQMIAPAERQQIHNRVSEVLVELPGISRVEAEFHSARAAGREALPSGDVPEAAPPSASSPPAAGAGKTVDTFALLRRARIPEAKTALTPEAADLAVKFLQSLQGELKIGKLYPRESKIRQELREKLREAAAILLGEAPVVTFSVDTEGLKINGSPVGRRNDTLREDVSALLSDRMVSSLTIRKGLAGREVDLIVEGLEAPLQKETTPPDHWDQWLKNRKVGDFDILQRRYLAQDEEAEFADVADLSQERPLKLAEVAELWAGLRYLKAAVDALRLYPPGHQLVKESMGQAERTFGGLLGRAGIVTLSTPEHDVICNGAALDSTGANATQAAWLKTELKKYGIQSLGLQPGVPLREIQVLASALIAPDAAAAAKIIDQGRLSHIVFGGRSYERVTENTKVRSRGPAEAAVRDPAKAPQLVSVRTDELGLEESARVLLRATVETFSSSETERALPAMLNDLLDNPQLTKTAGLIVERLARCLKEADPTIRARTGLIAAKALREAKPAARDLLVDTLREPLARDLINETDPAVLSALAETLQAWVAMAMAAGRRPPLVEVVAELLARRQDMMSRAPLLRTTVAATLKLLAMQHPEVAVEYLVGCSPTLQPAAVKFIALMGSPMISSMLSVILTRADTSVRRAAATALREIGGNSVRDLTGLVRNNAPAEQVTRVLGVYELAGPPDVYSVVLVSQQHPDPAVKEAGLTLARRARTLVTVGLLKALLRGDSREGQLAAVDIAKEARKADLAGDVFALVETSDDPEFLLAACRYFRDCPSVSALPLLQRVFLSRTKMFGLVKGISDDIRGAAVEAIRRIDDPRARDLLARAAGEKNETIRRAMNAPKPGTAPPNKK